MTIDFNYPEANGLLNRAVIERGPGYLYKEAFPERDCQYFVNGEPACIVGQVLSYRGLSEADLDEGGLNTTNVCDLYANNVLRGDLQTMALFIRAQDFQDQDVPWGPAFDRARWEIEHTIPSRFRTMPVEEGVYAIYEWLGANLPEVGTGEFIYRALRYLREHYVAALRAPDPDPVAA